MSVPLELALTATRDGFGVAALAWDLHMPFGELDGLRPIVSTWVGPGITWSQLTNTRTGNTRRVVTARLQVAATLGGCAAMRVCVQAGVSLRVTARRYPLTMGFDPVAEISVLGRKRRVAIGVTWAELPTTRSYDPTSGDAWDTTERFWMLSLRVDTMEREPF